MKEYIKKFESATNADNYSIVDIPFITSVAPSSGYPSISYIQNLHCNQTGKKLVNNNGIVSIYSDEPVPPVVPPNDEIWYTTTDGEPIELSSGGSGSGSGSGSGGGWPEHTNTYEGGKGVIKFVEDLTEIPNDGFSVKNTLASIEIPNSVTGIGSSAFNGCSGLTSITIPNSVTSIGIWVFYGCSGLTSPVYNTHVFACMPTSYSGAYTIPDGIESIADEAFYGCSGLTSVTIPDSVTSIGQEAFDGCHSLTSISYSGTMSQFNSIIKGAYWRIGVPATVVHCIDGDVNI